VGLIDAGTSPLRLAGAMPVRALAVEVVDGADKGRAAEVEAETLTVGTATGNALELRDPTVSRYHLEVVRQADGIAVADLGSTNGTYAGVIRLARGVVPAGTLLRVGTTTVRVGDARASVAVALHDADALAGIRGRSPAIRRVMAQVQRAGQSDTNALVVGESGTGKELVARALHALGPRARGPFVTVDCGAIAPALVNSELFGHEKGAFTSADRAHAGAFERADGGTLFLDEVGELSPEVQATLLGVLERRRFRRVGGRADLAANVRVVSATNRDLRAAVNCGGFRLDLYYRLAVVVLALPPLRERPDDVPVLVEHFLREAGHTGPVEAVVGPAALGAMAAHAWPGNVRELRNVVEAAVAMGEPPALVPGVAPGGVGPDGLEPGGDPIAPLLGAPYKDARARLLEAFEVRYIRGILAAARGNISQAARDARMDRSHLMDLMRRHGVR
jgi:DNA-binding NtrC family response regulator